MKPKTNPDMFKKFMSYPAGSEVYSYYEDGSVNVA